MAANPNWGEMVTATLHHRRKQIADAISKNNIYLNELRARKRIQPVPGGVSIIQPIMVGEENANFQWYQGRDALNVADQEVLSSAEFPWKQYACAFSMSGLEMLQNSGQDQVINMMKARSMHCEKTIVNQMHKSAHGDGTASAGKEFGGMQLLIANAAGATVGGINSGSYTWWDNQRKVGGTPTTANIYANMLDLYLKTQRGTDRVNLITSDDTYFMVFAQSLQAQQRFSNSRLAAAGFNNITFMDIPVVSDGGIGGYAPVGMKFLNVETITLSMHKDRNNVVLSGPKRALTEDSETAILAGMGNFTVENRMLNGVLSTT